nr:methyl-accepting chemotaxis protein [Oharaeibacter diazotrophicus]
MTKLRPVATGAAQACPDLEVRLERITAGMDPARAAAYGEAVRTLFETAAEDVVTKLVDDGLDLPILLDALEAAMICNTRRLTRGVFVAGRVGAVTDLSRRYALAVGAVHQVVAGRALADRAEEMSHEGDVANLRNLAGTVADVNEVAIEIAYLARNTRRATEGSQSIASAVAEMVASVDEIARSSADALDEARRADTASDRARVAVERLRETTLAITEATTETRTRASELESAFDQIAGVLQVIDAISRQTNLLALNATIEAARAGEAGKGFAVVAQEVKALANQTGSATEGIARRIAEMKAVIAGMGAAMGRSEAAVAAGGASIGEVTESVSAISDTVGAVTGRMDAIAAVLAQQKVASEEIGSRVAESATLASENEQLLLRMARGLHESNDRFSKSATSWFKAGSPRALCEMAKIDHVLFKKRVVDVLMGRAEWAAAEVPDHHGCRLGKWYDQIRQPEIRGLPAFAALVEPHARVHAAAKVALTHHAEKRPAEALAALADLNEASRAVLAGLADLADGLERDRAGMERRRHERRKVARLAKLTAAGGTRNAIVEDLSASGARVAGLRPEDVGTTVRLDHDGCGCEGTAVWSDGSRGGVRFVAERTG